MGFFSALGKIANVASFIPGPHQAITAPIAAASGLAKKFGGPVAGVASLLQGQQRNREALGAVREGMDFGRREWENTAPMRALAMRLLSQPTPEAPRQSGTFVDPTNPFARPSAPLNLSRGRNPDSA